MNSEHAHSVLTTADLTNTQKEKYASLQSIYKDQTLKCVSSLSQRGDNSFNALHEKLRRIKDSNYEQREYNDCLYSVFPIGETVTPNEMISRVAEARRDMELLPYDKRIKQQCERDFTQLFLYTEVFEMFELEGTEKRVFKGYRPLFKIKP